MRSFSRITNFQAGWFKPLLCALLLAGASSAPVHAAFHPSLDNSETAPPVDTLSCAKRNNVFYAGDPVVFTLSPGRGQNTVLTTHFQVRDYFGNLVASGQVSDGAQVSMPAMPLGWYKISFLGDVDRSGGGQGVSPGSWGFATGGTTFCVLRADSRFPTLPAPNAPNTQTSAYPNDEVVRGALALGPQRHSFTATLPGQPNRFDVAAISKSLGNDVALDKTYYLGQWQDSARPRGLLGHFANGVPGFASGDPDYEGLKQIVSAFKGGIENWEPRNEPQSGGAPGGAAYAVKEFKPFYDAIKSANPGAQVLAANTVGIGAGDLSWLGGFMSAGGDRMTDGFSFHAYNVANGDLALGRQSLDGLKAFLTSYGLQKVPIWQTEQGSLAVAYGAFKPRLQGRETMIQRMLFEQYNIPKERDVMWYDRSHGFWDVPVWWENDDTSLDPAAPLMRVYSEEVYGKTWTRSLDFGASGNNATIGNVFSGGLVVLMSAGNTQGRVLLSGAGGVSATDAWGNPVQVSSSNGVTSVPVGMLPVYVHGAGANTDAVKPNWGPNLCRQPGVSIVSNGGGGDIAKLHNGSMETWYYTQNGDNISGPDAPWNAGSVAPSPDHPITVEVDFPAVKKVRRVVIYAAPPWQSQSTLLDYDLQYFDGANWQTIETSTEPENTEKIWTPMLRCTVDSYFSDHWIFEHSFPAVSTNKLRLVVRKVTQGGAVNADEAGASEYATKGQGRLVLREIEAYEDAPVRYSISGHVRDVNGASPKGLAGAQVQMTGSSSASAVTDKDGAYRFDDLSGGGNYSVSLALAGQIFTPQGRSVQNISADTVMDFANPNGDGLSVDYFKSFDLSNFKTSRISSQVDFDWGYGGPLCSEAGLDPGACEAGDPAGIGIHDWTGRWSGQVVALSNETYTFHARADDGVRLWVNGQKIIDVFDNAVGASAIPIDRSGSIALQEGQKYDIRLEYVQRNQQSQLHLFWSTPTRPEEIVPQHVLYSIGQGTGLRGDYFGDTQFGQHKKTRLDHAINFSWGTGSPDPALDSNLYSVRWTGFIQPRFSEDYLFSTTSSDGIRVWINNQLVIDNWHTGNPNEQTSAPITLQRGVKVPIKVEYFDSTGNASAVLRWSSASESKQVVPQSQLYPSGGEGVAAQYFNDLNFGTLAQKRVDPQINFDWGTGSPDPAVNADGFSVRWHGQVEPWFSEAYTFSTLTDERVRLWVNGQLLIDDWSDHAATTDTAPSITLVGGQKYDLKMEYADVRGLASAKLFWQSANQPHEVVPRSQMYPIFDDATPTPGGGGAMPIVKPSISVALSSPHDGDTFYVGDTIGLSATANENGGHIAKVEFWANGAKLGETASAPYAWNWSGAQAGSVSLMARAFDDAGTSADSMPVTVSVAPGTSNSGPTLGTGLTGQYFDTEKFTQWKLTRLDPQINFDWRRGSPSPLIAPYTFSIRWTGQIVAPTTDTYTFYPWMDDGARLWINGQLIYDQWSYISNEGVSKPITLVAGQKYSFKMDYNQGYGDSRARLRWGSPSTPKALVPTVALFPDPTIPVGAAAPIATK